MVSFHKALPESSPSELKLSSNNNKRKWEQPLLTTEDFFKDLSKSSKTEANPHQKINKSIFDIEFHLQTPLPSAKLQHHHLTIQAGHINMSNTKMMNMKKLDSKITPETGIDLELNLTCESLRRKEDTKKSSPAILADVFNNKDTSSSSSSQSQSPSPSSSSPPLLPSWLLVEGEDQKEMVATVCMRCHMLVMLCKSSPSCPNCKFMHPPDQNPSFLKRSRCSLLC
ncbi:uncharacterized protein LOC130942256 [Arachis stenosperma]|uniref:uncharacterized protein LOC130942256 n=1 Tax=Arachis stenosperma TaxID=217475 RepID=UPI0025AD03FA|nr:uncharacterized protein LOC130942256 [Arachis stenosperma]